MLPRSFLAVPALLLLSACMNPSDTECPDCCPTGVATTKRASLACSLSWQDGGLATGVRGACTTSDAGALSDVNGTLTLQVEQRTCGVAAGTYDCAEVRFTADGGALSVVTDAGSAPGVSAPALAEKDCRLTVR